MHLRINISLPEETIRLIDRVAERGDRSRFIDRAVKQYVETTGRRKLGQLMKERAIKRADFDLRLAADWFPLEEEAWSKRQK